MANNFNPLTNAVGGNGATAPNVYYNQTPSNFGEYGYIYLNEIVDNFTAAYVGEGKILANVLKADVNFHAHRALQELHYDTLKSCKSQEIEVCPSLKMPLPHDYVNYVKLTWVDAKGIEHVIYPTRHTSNPFAIEQDDDCGYVMNGTVLQHQKECEEGREVTCSGSHLNYVWNFTQQNLVQNWDNCTENGGGGGYCFPFTIPASGDMTEEIVATDMMALQQVLAGVIDNYCYCLQSLGENNQSGVSCGTFIGWNWAEGMSGGWEGGTFHQECHGGGGGSGEDGGGYGNCDSEYVTEIQGLYTVWSYPDVTARVSGNCTLHSNTWTNYSSSASNSTGTGVNNSHAADNDTYYLNNGERYGLETSLAQNNGSYFIDCLRGNIHFSSNLSGKTIILKYISDGHGTDDEMIVPKLAEEAMYKWIAYGCASARTDVPPGTVQMLKREKFAETRKAKIRLSNIKLEEISQVFRGKSKWIKH